MKTINILIILFFSIQVIAQNEIIGKYTNPFGNKLVLKADSTFEYKWIFDLSSSWTNGKWSYKKRVITLESFSIYDTIVIKKENGDWVKDRLVLSGDSNSNKISQEDYLINLLGSSKQNRVPPPTRLFYKKNKLIIIGTDGKFVKKKVSGFGTNKKYRPWYKKKKPAL